MKRAIVVVCLLLLGAASWGLEAVVNSNPPGNGIITRADGTIEDAHMRSVIELGDTLSTSTGGPTELRLVRGTLLRVTPGTVIELRELIVDGTEMPSLMILAGSAELVLERESEIEYWLASPTAIVSATGANVSIYVGADGRTRFEVYDGKAVVAGAVHDLAGGNVLELESGEGIEVAPALRPRNTFALGGSRTDFDTWINDRMAQFLSKPTEALEGVRQDLDSHMARIRVLRPTLDDLREEIEDKSLTYALKAEKEGRAAATSYFIENILPLQTRAAVLDTEMRQAATMGLHIRRYMLATLYAEMASRYFASRDSQEYLEFASAYADTIAILERDAGDYLWAGDEE